MADSTEPGAVSSAPLAPRRIARLPESVVNRIAAGEVVTRPAAALKEMLENSLDAQATSVSVLVKGGGLQMLQISDTGTGIQKEDFPLVCERFATSKLRRFEDLSHIGSYGFRGEALASISYVAQLTLVSMTAGAPCAFKATFANGKMVGEARPCAGVRGSIITVENMFASMPDRRATVRSAAEEYQACLAVVQKYGLHSAHKGVSFSCKKVGDTSPDAHIPAGTSVEDAIGIVYGPSVRRELLHMSFKLGAQPAHTAASQPTFDVDAYVTNANYSSKRSVFILFINNRLVDNDALKRAIDSVYAEVLPKHAHPLVYMSVHLPPEHLDVNVHPTKREVSFLYQDELLDAVVARLNDALAGANSSRRFATQTVLPTPALAPAGPDPMSLQRARLTEHVDSPMSAAINSPASTAADGVLLNLEQVVHARAHAAVELVRPPVAVSTPSTEASDESAAVRRSDSMRTVSTVPEMADLGTAAPLSVPVAGRAREAVAAADAVTSRRRSGFALMSATQPSTQVYRTVRTFTDSQTLHAFLLPAAGTVSEPQVDSRPSKRARAADSHQQMVDALLQPLPSIDTTEEEQVAEESEIGAVDNDEDPSQLESVQRLHSAVAAETHEALQAIVKKHVFVGIVTRHLSMIQYNTRLFLVNHTQLAREFFYQAALRSFGRCAVMSLSPPMDVQRVCEWTLCARRGIYPGDAGADAGTAQAIPAEEADVIVADCVELAAEVATLLLSKAEMLAAYFGIRIQKVSPSDASAGKRTRTAAASAARVCLTSLPSFVADYTPQPSAIPEFLLSLAYDVDWQQELPCFHSVCQALAALFAEPPLFAGDPRAGATSDLEAGAPDEAATWAPGSLHAVVSTVFYPSFRSALAPPRKLSTQHHVVQVASTEQLYRIFERC